jgi:hypothetical protein
VTGTVADASTTTIAVSSATPLKSGMTLLLGAEQVYIESITGSNLTVTRAVNGTTGTAHAGATVYLAQYPSDVVRGVDAVCTMIHRNASKTGLQSETIKNYSYTKSNTIHEDMTMRRLFNRVRREPWF